MKHQCKLINVLNIGIAFFWFLATLLVGVGLSSNPAEAQPFAYVIRFQTGCFCTGTASVIDTDPDSADFNKVISTVEVESFSYKIAITPDGTRAYVTNSHSDTVSVIDSNPSSADFNKVVSTIELEKFPYAIAITPDGTRVYVSNLGSRTLSVIDSNPGSADFNKVVASVELGRGSSPYGLAITPDGTRAYVTNSRAAGTVSVIDTDPSSIDFNKVVSKIGGVGYTPDDIAITPDGTRAYVANTYAGTVSVIDTDPSSIDFNKVISTVEVASSVSAVAITPDGTRAYVTAFGSNYSRRYVAVIDTETDTVIDTIEVVGTPRGLAITPDGTRVYVAAFWAVQVIDTSNNIVVDTLPMQSYAAAVAITPSVDTYLDFAAFEIDRARVKLHQKPGRDQFKVVGSFELEGMIDEIDFLNKKVTVTLGGYSETIAWGDFVREDGKIRYKGDSGSITEIKIRDDGRFSVKGKGLDLSSINLDSRVNPVNFDLKLGGYSGKTEIQLDRKGRFGNKKGHSRKGKDDDD